MELVRKRKKAAPARAFEANSFHELINRNPAGVANAQKAKAPAKNRPTDRPTIMARSHTSECLYVGMCVWV